MRKTKFDDGGSVKTRTLDDDLGVTPYSNDRGDTLRPGGNVGTDKGPQPSDTDLPDTKYAKGGSVSKKPRWRRW